MIPALNVSELMLRADVVEAVGKGEFHIYAVRTVDEGIEILSGKRAGRWVPRRGFEHNSMHELVDRGLRHFHDCLRDAEDGAREPEPKKKEKVKAKPTNDKAPKRRRRKPEQRRSRQHASRARRTR
jgi:ATP-dependent Lon protease